MDEGGVPKVVSSEIVFKMTENSVLIMVVLLSLTEACHPCVVFQEWFSPSLSA